MSFNGENRDSPQCAEGSFKGKSVRIAATAVWMGLIFYASSLPGSATGPDTLIWVLVLKTLHFVSFGVLALLILSLLRGNRALGETPVSACIIALLLSAAYAISDEYHKSFVPGRHATVRDVLIDTTGAIVFVAGGLRAARNKMRKKGVPHGKIVDRR